jgi:signal transduction histidine kinase
MSLQTNSNMNLSSLAEEVMATWEKKVRGQVTSAGDLLRPDLRDALPRFLQLLAEALSEPEARGLAEESIALVKNHSAQRARDTSFGAAELVHEFQILREAVTMHMERVMNLSPQDYSTIQQTFDETIQEALMEFFQVHTKLREEFTATLGHDLRNPIGIARMAAEIIKDLASAPTALSAKEEIIDLSTRIIKNMDRADKMIQRLLDASILKIGKKLPITITGFDLYTLAKDVVDQLEESKDRIQLKGESVVGSWDVDALRRSIENLISNAIKYGDKDKEITVKISSDKDRVKISVHNYGNHIPKEEQNLIFRNFGRSDSAKAKGAQGWGIGLAYVRAIATSLGGTVHVESSNDNGTTFTVELPKDAQAHLKQNLH